MSASLFQRILDKYRLTRNRRYNIEIFRRKGVQIGEKTGIQTGCYLDPAYPYLIEIGNHCAISNNVTILTHDATIDRFLGVCRIGKVKIKDWCVIGINVTILPNVTIGPYSLIGAGSVVTHDITPNTIAVGNPAKVICTIEEVKEKHKDALKTKPCFPRLFYDKPELPESLRVEMCKALEGTYGYLVGEKK